MTMLIGSSCSEVTETIGEIAHYWNLILVSMKDMGHFSLDYGYIKIHKKGNYIPLSMQTGPGNTIS